MIKKWDERIVPAAPLCVEEEEIHMAMLAEIDELRAKLAAAETSANELRRAVAELIGADPETWPNHGNAPLAIAAYVAVQQAAGAESTFNGKSAEHWNKLAVMRWQENQVLEAKLAALEVLYLDSLADATQWQLYKSRKDAVIAAGMGKKVMRDSAAGAAPGNIVVTKTQAGQIVAVTRQNEEGQIIEVIAESAGAAPVHKEPVAWMAWNSQHHCYDYGEASETDALGRVVEYLFLEGEV